MFLFKRLFCLMLLSILLSSTTFAANIKTNPRKFSSLNFATISISYLSWGEKVSLSQAGKPDQAHCNMLGNSLGVEWEHYFEPRYGFTLQGSLLFGVADVGGTQSKLPFSRANQHWWGAGASTHFAYRFSKWVISSLGPILVYRNLSLSNDPSGTSAESGATVNIGATVDLRMRLSDQLEIREEIGSLAINASTYWSVGLGYKF